jgi:hypothetical protein
MRASHVARVRCRVSTAHISTQALCRDLAGDDLPRGPTLSARTRTSEHVTFRQSSEVESLMIKGKIVRIIVLVAGATGLLALFETTAHAGTNLNHCEPLQRV